MEKLDEVEKDRWRRAMTAEQRMRGADLKLAELAGLELPVDLGVGKI